MMRWFEWAGQRLYTLYLFVRFAAFGFSAILPLLGAVTVSPHLSISQMLGLVGVALSFHSFAYVLNDVVDLPLDRTEPLRSNYPLVRGTIQRSHALVFALFQIPITLALTALRGDGWAYAALGASLVLMMIYNIWGKRTPFPPFTDAIQGFAWGALALYGSAAALGRPTILTCVLFIFVVVYIVMINGVHGSLRDLSNDLNNGVRSTAILLGARPQGDTGLAIPVQVKLYAFTLQTLLTVIALLPLAFNWFGYGAAAWGVTTGIIMLLGILQFHLLMIAAKFANDRQRMMVIGLAHLSVALVSLIVLFAWHMDGGALTVVLAVYLVPLLMTQTAYAILWRGLRRWTITVLKRLSLGFHWR